MVDDVIEYKRQKELEYVNRKYDAEKTADRIREFDKTKGSDVRGQIVKYEQELKALEKRKELAKEREKNIERNIKEAKRVAKLNNKRIEKRIANGDNIDIHHIQCPVCGSKFGFHKKTGLVFKCDLCYSLFNLKEDFIQYSDYIKR